MKVNRASMSVAAQVLYKAVEHGRPIDIPIQGGKKDAEAYRFKLYQARKAERKAAADYQHTSVVLVRHELDILSITILEKEKGQWVVRLMPVADHDIKMIDTETGEELSIAYMPEQLTEDQLNDPAHGMDQLLEGGGGPEHDPECPLSQPETLDRTDGGH